MIVNWFKRKKRAKLQASAYRWPDRIMINTASTAVPGFGIESKLADRSVPWGAWSRCAGGSFAFKSPVYLLQMISSYCATLIETWAQCE